METEMTLKRAISEIMAYKGASTNMRFAKSYAEAWKRGERNTTQLMYIRANLSGWRGDTAKLVREILDKEIARDA